MLFLHPYSVHLKEEDSKKSGASLSMKASQPCVILYGCTMGGWIWLAASVGTFSWPGCGVNIGILSIDHKKQGTLWQKNKVLITKLFTR
jgi:hypothetical protein